jgi:N-methylhydantoinase A
MLPSVDVSSIGAGGGSIAYTDNLGMLKVGPQSAGADPGPVAYGRGGTQPTVTDAYLVSGFIDPENFLGGRLSLDMARAQEALRKLGEPLRLDAQQVAAGILAVATSALVAEFTRLAAKKGLDVREFAMIPFGGAGATHACLVADELSMRHVAIPYSPGTFCATGATLSDFRLDYLKNVYQSFERLDGDEVDAWFDDVEARARHTLRDSQRDIADIRVIRGLGVRYRGQGFEVPVAFERLQDVPKLFAAEYSRLYGPRLDDGPLDVVSLRATVVGATPKPAFAWNAGSDQEARAVATRVLAIGGKAVTCPVFRRADMAPGWKGSGPLVVDQPDTTCVVTAGWQAEVDAAGTLHLRKES